jgi:hypothetical protein
MIHTYAHLCGSNSKKGLVNIRNLIGRKIDHSCYPFWISEATSLKNQALGLHGADKMMK